ncbi:MAG: endonuclease V, partial [Candidatus Eremiobacterota bacterium]
MLEPLPEARMVGGLDVHYGGDKAWASIVVVREDLETEASYSIWQPVDEPYLPGLFALREGPVAAR